MPECPECDGWVSIQTGYVDSTGWLRCHECHAAVCRWS